jgi:hypothetical protein
MPPNDFSDREGYLGERPTYPTKKNHGVRSFVKGAQVAG